MLSSADDLINFVPFRLMTNPSIKILSFLTVERAAIG